MMYSGSDSNVGIIFRFESFTPKIFFHMCEQLLITWGKIWSVGRMCQHIPPPNIAPDFAHHNGEELLHCPGAIWCHAQSLLVVYGEEPQSILQLCAVILAIDHHTNWHGMVKHKAISAEEHAVHDFQAPWLHCAVFFLNVWARLSAVRHFCWGSNECICDSSSIKIWSWNASSLFLQCCRWVVAGRTCVGLWSLLSTCGIHFAHPFCFPELLVRIW